MKRIVTIVGARPQFIKASALSRAFKEFSDISEKIIHTGQHYDRAMSDVFFSEMQIQKPAFNLNIGSDSHGAQTGKMLIALEGLLLNERPDIVVVYGDTNSTLAGALCAIKLHIPIAHVEAGLRSFNRKMPEEINRIMTDHVSEWLFTPTITAVNNLIAEGIATSKVFNYGDVMYDTALFFGSRTVEKNILNVPLPFDAPFILATIHRAENTDDPKRLAEIFNTFENIAAIHPIVIPLHPRTIKMLEKIGFKKSSKNIHIIDPVGYLEMIHLQKRCALVITDSGGLQKEAFFMGKYCLTLRSETEWLELVEIGVNVLVIELNNLLKFVLEYFGRNFDPTSFKLYGDGNAAFKIAETLKKA